MRHRRSRPVGSPSANAWTTQQLGAYIGMSRSFIVREIDHGELAASKFGREYRIARSEVVRYLLAHAFPVPDSLAS